MPFPTEKPATHSSSMAQPSQVFSHTLFVGRQQELRQLQEAFDATSSDCGSVILFTGEPGIGKTRLAEEAATLARDKGMRVLWGRCWEGEGAPVFWPWLQMIRTYLQHGEAETLAADMGAGAAHIARVVAEVQERFPHLPAPPPLDPEQARFALFDSITMFLKRAAQRMSLLLIFDDLHWSDASSLLLLRFLAREIQHSRILGIGAYRQGVEMNHKPGLTEEIGLLSRESRCVTLQRLEEPEIARLIEETAGVSPSAAFVAHLRAKADGNPFFITEIIRLLSAEGKLPSVADSSVGVMSIPLGVRETLHRRLGRLSMPCTQLLTIAAVIGQEFDRDMLAHLRRPTRRGMETYALAPPGSRHSADRRSPPSERPTISFSPRSHS